MNPTHVPQRYARLSIALHWLMVLLFVGVYACIQLRDLAPRGSELKGELLGVHGLFGAAIFLLVWVRVVVRLLNPRPPINPAPSALQAAIAHLMHLALYGLMILTPLLAWGMLTAGDKPFPYFGFQLPAPIVLDPQWARPLKHWHEWIGSLGYWLIGLHAIAGLFHHYLLGDNTLRRMWPKRG